MKHASPELLEQNAALLDVLRSRLVDPVAAEASASATTAASKPTWGCKEKKLGVFYRKSRAFLHFHEDDGALFADVRVSGTEFERMPCRDQQELDALIAHIDAGLSTN